MIYTRWGSAVKIVGAHEDGTVDIRFLNNGDKLRKVYVHELKASEGIKEIDEAIKKILVDPDKPQDAIELAKTREMIDLAKFLANKEADLARETLEFDYNFSPAEVDEIVSLCASEVPLSNPKYSEMSPYFTEIYGVISAVIEESVKAGSRPKEALLMDVDEALAVCKEKPRRQ